MSSIFKVNWRPVHTIPFILATASLIKLYLLYIYYATYFT